MPWSGRSSVRDEDTVTRRLSDVRGYLVPGLEAGFESNVYSGDPRQARGLPFRTVEVHTNWARCRPG